MYLERPLLIPFLALAIGLTVADFFSISLSLLQIVTLLSTLIFSSFLRSRALHILLTFFFFFALGLYTLGSWKLDHLAHEGIHSFAGKNRITVEGVIVARPVETIDGSNIVLETDLVIQNGITFKTKGKLQVFIAAGGISVVRGDRVRFDTRITVPHTFGLPGEFDYKRYLVFRGITATARINSADELLLVRGGERESLLRSIDLHALKLGKMILQAVPEPERSSVLIALLLGDQKRIPENLLKAYTKAGVNHILSVSGFHIGIIVFFIVQLTLYATSRCNFLLLEFNLRRSLLLLSLPAMVAYLLLTGSSPATARSVIMLAAFVLALYVERESDILNVLLLAAMMLVIMNPPTFFDMSFQLSFLSLWGIIVITPLLMVPFRKTDKTWASKLLQFLSVSAAASLITCIPVLFFWGQASLYGILTNLLIVPLLGYGAVLSGFTALALLNVFTPAAVFLLTVAGGLVDFSNKLIIRFSELPSLTFYGITKWDMIFFLLALFVITFLRKKIIKAITLLILLVIAIVLHLQPLFFADGRLHLTMLSVGQAESILIHFPNGSIMLVDGGGYLYENGKDFGERMLVPALLKLGVRRIDKMVMTHSHPDHAGGLTFAAEKFPVGEFLESACGGSGVKYQALKDLLAEKGVPTRRLYVGEKIQPSPGVVFTVLSPPVKAASFQQNSDENEESLVLHLRYGKATALLTADAGFTAEDHIMLSGEEISAQLLKVGHHGSRYSTSEIFLDRVAPKIALISTGRDNSFGLPSPNTIRNLQNRGIRIYRTDQSGTIIMSTDGSAWSCTSLYSCD